MLLVLQALVAQLQSCPSQVTLEQVKDILPYASPSWLHLFGTLGGPGLLMDALDQHLGACRSQVQQQQDDGGSGSTSAIGSSRTGGSRPAAADALAAAQECIHALMEHDGGKQKLILEHPRVLQLLAMCLTCQVWRNVAFQGSSLLPL